MDSNKSFHKGNLYIQLLAPGSNLRTTPKGQWCVLPKIGVLAWWWCQGCPKVRWQTPVAYNRKHTSRPETYSVRYFVWLLASVKEAASRSSTSQASLFGSLRSVQCGRGCNRSNKVPTRFVQTAYDSLHCCSVFLKVGNVGIRWWQNTGIKVSGGLRVFFCLFFTFLCGKTLLLSKIKLKVFFFVVTAI